jgi:type 1 glutamine amidotransferase
LVALLALGLSCSSTPEEERDARVLLFTKTAGFRHESITPAVAALRRKGESAGVEVDASEDASVFNRAELSRYDAVVFLMTSGDVLDDAQQGALTEFIGGGGGFAGVHSATDTEYGWPWYGQLVGAYFVTHPSNPGVRSGRLSVRAPGHPATRSLPTPWVRSDEWYEFRNLQPGVTVLLDIDETSYKTAAENPASQPRPIAWSRTFGGGRSFYTALGHPSESWAEPLFTAHVWGGIESVLRDGGT